MAKKKILFFTTSFEPGGTEKVTYDIITHLDPNKFDITWMGIYGGGEFSGKLPSYVHVKSFFHGFIRFVVRFIIVYPKLAYKIFIKDDYDVEIACGDDIPSRVIGNSMNKKSKKIAWIHMDVIARGYKGLGVKTEYGRKRFYSGFDKIITVSHDCEKQFKIKFGDMLPTMTIYNPIDSKNIRNRSLEKPDVILPDNTFNIVCIGRFTDQKGFDRLVEAYRQIVKDINKNVEITIIGDGYLKDDIQQQIDNCGLSVIIQLIGYHSNPYPILAQADLFLLTSRDESFALVVAEAMVLGVPVMSTRCTGPIELLKDGENGLLVGNSTEGIRDGLFKVLTDEHYYERMKVIATKNKENFDITKTMEVIDKLLDC